MRGKFNGSHACCNNGRRCSNDGAQMRTSTCKHPLTLILLCGRIIPANPACVLLHTASIPRRVASRDFSHVLERERERGELRHGWGRAELGMVRRAFSLSLDFKVSLFSLSFVIVRERAPESHSAGSVCHLRRRRPWCTVKRLRRFGARCALAMDSQDSC